MTYKIIGDSCLDLTEELKRDPRFQMVPLTLQVGAAQVVDDETFDQKAFIRMVKECPECPKTACPSPEIFKEAYEAADAEAVFVITLSSHLSGSYNSAALAKQLYEEEMKEKVTIDMEMPFLCVTEELVKELELLEPFGKGNTKPIFAARGVTLLGARILGKNRNVLKIKAQDANGSVIEAMLFQNVEGFLKNMEETYGRMEVDALLQGRGGHIKIAVTYYPDINEYMGKRTPQIVITHYR